VWLWLVVVVGGCGVRERMVSASGGHDETRVVGGGDAAASPHREVAAQVSSSLRVCVCVCVCARVCGTSTRVMRALVRVLSAHLQQPQQQPSH
jgi:hypothetical protein